MSRLIDADKVISILEQLNEHSLTGNMNIQNALYLIDEQATAYDVEKVVQQLEEERELSYADFDRYVEEVSPCLDTEYDDFFHRGLERAVRIVKGG